MANFEPAIDRTRGFNAKVAALPRDNENLTENPATLDRLQDGGEYCSGGKA